MSDWALAIDFGTTNTTAALSDGGRPELLEVGGTTRLPSLVLLGEDGGLIVGVAADHQAGLAPDRVERNPKRSLGRTQHLVLGGQPVPVVDAVAAVLRSVVEEARRRRGGTEPAEVVLTHPVRWGERRLDALVAAAVAAGLPSPRLVPEPVAAAVHYAADLEVGAHVAVYDLGGGTFDVAVLRRTDDGFVLAGQPGGSSDVGGEHFDDLLTQHLGATLAELDPEVWERMQHDESRLWRRHAADLRLEARRAKEALSDFTQHTVYVPAADRDLRLTRSEFEDLVRAELLSSVDELRATIRRAGLEQSDLAAIYLTGGSSRIPMVTRLVADRTGVVPTTYDDPKAVVVMGATRLLGSSEAGTRPEPAVEATADADDAPAAAVPVGDASTTPDPSDGPPDAADAELDGSEAGGDSPVAPDVEVDPAGASDTTAPRPTEPARLEIPEVAASPRRERRVPVIAAAIGAVVLVAAGGGMFLARGGEDASDPTATGAAAEATQDDPTETAELLATEEGFRCLDDDPVVPAAELEPAWRVDLDAPAVSRPVRGGDHLVVATLEGVVVALDPADGSEAWRRDTGAAVTAGLAVGDDGAILVATVSGELLGLDAVDGAIRWRVEVGEAALGAPTAAGASVLVGAADGTLVAIDPVAAAEGDPDGDDGGTDDDGDATDPIRWRYDAGDAIFGAPAIEAGVAYAGSLDGSVHAVSLETGARVRTFDAGGPVEAPVALRDDDLVVATTDGKVRAIDLRSGEQRWEATVPQDRGIHGRPVVTERSVLVGASDCAVHRLERDDGTATWTVGVRGAIDAPLATAAGVVHVPSDDGYLYGIAGSDGTARWFVTVGEPVGGPLVSRDAVFVAGEGGSVLRVDLDDR